MPVNNAIGTIVLATESRNIDMVFVAGGLRKWQGKLIGQDIDALRTMVRDFARLHRRAGRLRHPADASDPPQARRDPAPPRRQLRLDRRSPHARDLREHPISGGVEGGQALVLAVFGNDVARLFEARGPAIAPERDQRLRVGSVFEAVIDVARDVGELAGLAG